MMIGCYIKLMRCYIIEIKIFDIDPLSKNYFRPQSRLDFYQDYTSGGTSIVNSTAGRVWYRDVFE